MADYLGEFDGAFQSFAHENRLAAPYHLTLTPKSYATFVKKNGKSHEDRQQADQGEMSKVSDLNYWDGHKLFRYANHLYNHWNVTALSDRELAGQFQKNDDLLKTYKSSIPLFAYPNGQPGTCYDISHNKKIIEFGVQLLFSATGRMNPFRDDTVLDRVALTAWHDRSSRFWYGLGRNALFNQ